MSKSVTATEDVRKNWRTKCRTTMSTHIRERLGLHISPADVRLVTTPGDLYSWKVVPGKEHLFKHDILNKHLSRHSIGAYRHLCRAIGVTLEAVPMQLPNHLDSTPDLDLRSRNSELETALAETLSQLHHEQHLHKEAQTMLDSLRGQIYSAREQRQEDYGEIKMKLLFIKDSILRSADEHLSEVLRDIKAEIS